MNSTIVDMIPFASYMKMEVTEALPERVVGKLYVTADHCTTGERIHGGAVMAFADTLGAVGASLNLPDGAAGTTTLESKTNFLGSAPMETSVVGETTALHVGRRTSVWQTRVYRESDGRNVAYITQTQMVL